MKIYLATWLRDYTNGPSLTRAGNTNRLVSYYLFQEEAKAASYPEDALKTYVKTGEFESRKSRR